MTAAQAKNVERIIVGFCVLSILAIFQPFSIHIFSVGCVAVIISALVFNLVPHCREGVTVRDLLKVWVIILVILGVAALLGIGTAFMYVKYLASLR